MLPQDPAIVGGTGAPVLFVAWTLQYELLFYTVMGLLIANRVLGGLVVAALLSMQISCHFGVACSFPVTFLGSKLVWLFAFGGFAAWAVDRPGWSFPRPLLIATVGIMVMITFGLSEMSWLGKDLPIERRFVYGILSAIILMSLVQSERRGAFHLRKPWIGLLGDSSYALYLLHIPVISTCVKVAIAMGLKTWWGTHISFVGTVIACVLAGCLFHMWVERPLLRSLSPNPKKIASGSTES